MATIWRYERRIVEACAEQLERALARLDCQISPSVFLVGVNCSTDEIEVLPDGAPVTAAELQDYVGVADGHVCYPDEQLTDPQWDEEFQRFDRYCWDCWGQIRDGVAAIVAPKGLLFSVSPCFEINGYMVALVVTYSRVQYEQYPHMDMEVFTVHGRWPALHFGVVEAVLNEFGEELRKRDAGRRHIETVERDRLLRVTAEFFTRCNVWAGKRLSALDLQFRGTLDFFDACNTISSMPYESRQGSGGMIVADAGHQAVEVTMQTNFPVLADNHRRVRKLVEMCQGGLAVLTDSRYVWGLGQFHPERYDSSRAEVLQVRFHGHGRWVLSHLGTDLMDVRRGDPQFPRAPVDFDNLRGHLVGLFGDGVAQDRLIEAVQHAIRAEHGTVLVISANAEGESTRLAGSHAGFRPFDPTEATIAAASSIDGALMLDLQGRCLGGGLILDGEAGPNEDPARGARYNSVIRYLRRCAQHQIPCLVVVVSEDGMINVLPQG
jgi:hypothetical protein